MEVTKLIITGRDRAKIKGNWVTYRKQLTKQIHNLRKKLGVATKPRAKCAGRVKVTKDDIAQNYKYGHLLLLTSERAWANAMCMRKVHLTEKRGITSSTRSHIISRLQKSTIYARNLLDVLQNDSIPIISVNDVLETRAYVATLSGALEFEKKNWEKCINFYSEARIIYCALSTSTKSEIFKDLLSDPVDVSIRYCAYQMQLPRSLAVTDIARKYFRISDAWLLRVIEQLDAGVPNSELAKSGSKANTIPSTITWRSRTINLEDPMIILALESVQTAEIKIAETLATIPSSEFHERAAAYDDILTVSQDAVDATKHAIDQLLSEGISQDDQHIQNLQITHTAISYDMISWRIGRNRELLGEQDGVYAEQINTQPTKNSSKETTKLRSIQQRLARLRESVVLYDSILQSLNSIKDLAGIAADDLLMKELDARYEYFSSLKCLTIARSHSLLFQNRNALALFSRALSKCDAVHMFFSSAMEIEDLSMKISVNASAIQSIREFLNVETQRHRALVEISNLIEIQQSCEDPNFNKPLVERLSDFPARGVNLTNLVAYPPVLKSAPVKPLFFDAAWNYVRYPGNEVIEPEESKTQSTNSVKGPGKDNVTKKRWFGLGL